MRRSDLFCPTSRETRGDGTRARKLLLRAGLIREFGSGLWALTPAGQRVREKLLAKLHEEMASVGAQRVHLPGLQYRDRWEQSGRWGSFEGEMLTLKNRDDQDMCLAPSHEEGMVHLLDGQIRSYEDLPLTLYQTASKFRDDHARNGLVRCKEFTMKDAYSFHCDEESLAVTYREIRDAYERIFSDVGLEFAIVDADNSVMGGSASEEFLAPVDEGSDRLLHCTATDCRFGVTDEHEAFDRVAAGDDCPDCGGDLTETDGIEVGHVFQLGTRYADAMDLTVDDADGNERTVQMGSYGIGVERLLQTLVQQHADEDGCRFPVTDWGCVAPYRAAVIPIGADDERDGADDGKRIATVAREIHDGLCEETTQQRATGDDALLYDDLSVGERFAESDLLGIPAKIVVGNTFRETGLVDVETRDGETRQLSPEDAIAATERFAATSESAATDRSAATSEFAGNGGRT
jgi:prolyl-tRNA synthetase